MADYLDIDDSNLDDIEEDTPPVDEDEEDEESDLASVLDENLPSRNVVNYQKKISSKEEVYTNMYNYDTYITTDMLTKYEKARLIGLRAQMIANRAPTLVDTGDLKDPIAKAEKELAEGKLPFIIDRLLPSKVLKKPKHEYRRVAELQQ